MEVKEKDMSKRCGAKRGDGTLCMAWGMKTNGRCKMHGGKTPTGIHNHNYKHGKYSKHMPKKLLEGYEKSLRDPELLTLKNEIAVIDSRLIELLGKVDQGEAGALWAKLKNTYDIYLKEDDGLKQANALSRLGTLIKRGYKDHMTWTELYTVLDHRKKLVESERKRYTEMSLMITAEQAAMMMAQVSRVINDTVTSVDDKRNVAMKLTELMGKLEKPLDVDIVDTGE